jgi:predicted metal-dependent hydrolase
VAVDLDHGNRFGYTGALLLQRKNRCAEAADHWRHYLAIDGQSEWAARARLSLKFCEMQQHLSFGSINQ